MGFRVVRHIPFLLAGLIGVVVLGSRLSLEKKVVTTIGFTA